MNQETAKKLFEYRKANGYSQEELALKIGVSRQAISKWERGESSPDTDNLIALARLYGITIDELLNISPSEKKQEAPKEEETQNESEEETPKGTRADISFKNGIHVHDGEDNVDIDFNGIHVESKNGDKVHIDAGGINVNDDDYSAGKNPWLHVLLPTAAVVGYLILGFTTPRGWACGWILFLLIPVIESLFTAVKTKNPSRFSYPVLATAVFLFVGMVFGIWHPTWIVFLTIPAYYALCDVYKKTQNQKSTNKKATYYSPETEEDKKKEERKNKLGITFSIICSVIIVAAVAAACVFGFSGGSFSNGTVLTYEHAELYNIGGSEISAEEINAVEVEWVSGNINIQPCEANTISFSEELQSDRSALLRWRIEGGTLKIKFCESGFSSSINTNGKDLTVYIPQDKVLTKLEIDNVSGEAYINAVSAGKLVCDTVSGDCEIYGAFNSVDIDSVSADVSFKTEAAPTQLNIDTISGKSTVILPADISGFTLDYETVSGRINTSAFTESEKNFRGEGYTTYGTGGTSIDFESISGDFTVKKG